MTGHLNRRRAIGSAAAAGAALIAGVARPQPVAQHDELAYELASQIANARIRDAKLADDRENEVIASYTARIASLRGQANSEREENSSLEQQLGEAQAALAQLQAQIVDRAVPGQTQQDQASAAAIAQSNAPLAQEALESGMLSGRTFIMYLPYGNQITPDGLAIVDQAALFALNLNNVTIYVTGHWDTSVSDNEALRLSRADADAVAAALVARGVPTTSIYERAAGKTDLAVETGDGMHEPLNRRVTIVVKLGA